LAATFWQREGEDKKRKGGKEKKRDYEREGRVIGLKRVGWVCP